jgi:alkylated DNA repair protein (DNA oxidative demethylase)
MVLWRALMRFGHPPEACLINFYGAHAKMGLHQDRDELEFDAPVISVSLGNSCLFRAASASATTLRTLSD